MIPDTLSVSLSRIDQIFMEDEPLFMGQQDYLRIIARQANKPIEQIYRVKFENDGAIRFYSFALPKKNLAQDSCLNDVSMLPLWVQERLAILQICQEGQSIEGVGQKVSENVYYVIE